ncbi:uncharacterized protein AB9X84_002370 isoform 2-T2 [Acanthopagrus schlegelii]
MDGAAVSGNRFCVHVAGKTIGAHLEYITNLNRIGQIEVSSPEESDYIVVFCPIASRVGTDVGEALESLPAGKPAILVVMHHTFNPNQVVAESRRQVTNPNVRLTVDCLFHDGKFLSCTHNRDAWHAIQRTLGVPVSQASGVNASVCYRIKDHPKAVGGAVVIIVLLVVVIIIVSVIIG